MQCKDKVAIVTGGTRGIGHAIALMLAREGADICFSYLKNTEAAESLAQEIEKLGGKARALQLDVRDFEKSKELVETAKSHFGRLDIVVNNAGITRDKALMMMTQEDWHEVIDTNLNGAFNVTRHAIVTFLKQRQGNIVTITSVTGLIGLPRQTNYAAAKAGLIGFTKALAREVAAYNIRVNAVAPGLIETDMVAHLKEEYKEALKKRIPLGRFGKAEEVAATVRFLLSESAGFITGQTIVLDGGLSIV
ncbi:MAG: 3-oxoacyl-[acyl-carrier-protein] reductase [Candidatus Omnitrophica bacterium]|nr:3-oxoacyl-[acyl-carrier-protein] reductase [Candidatus Omnitrophota bacterium]